MPKRCWAPWRSWSGEQWMKNLDFRRYALSSCVAAAMLAGCGGQTSSGVVTVSGAPNSVSGHHTFNFTGTAQIFRVPYGVTQIRVIALGGNGAVLATLVTAVASAPLFRSSS